MYCTSCGKEVRKGAKFCPSCGAAMKEMEAAADIPPKKIEKTEQPVTRAPRIKGRESGEKQGKTNEKQGELGYLGYSYEKKTESEMVIEEPSKRIATEGPSRKERFTAHEHTTDFSTPTPTGVKIISILTAITGIIYLFNGILSIPVIPTIFTATTLTTIAWGVIAILLLLFSLMLIWISIGLWRMRRSSINRYQIIFIVNFVLLIAHIFLYWYDWGWAIWPKFTGYFMFYIQMTPWLIFNWIAGWGIFFYLFAVRHIFKEEPDSSSTLFS